MARSKTEYWASPEGLRLLEAWTEEKLTDVEIAEKIGISRSTLSKWKKENKLIADALDFSEKKANRKKFEYWMSPYGMLLVEAWARNGLLDEELSEKMGISRSTLSDWKIRFPLFAALLAKTKEIADVQVENASFKTALGYDYTEQQAYKLKTVYYDLDSGKKSMEVETMVIIDLNRHQPADIKAQIWWLKNRMKDVWKDRQVIEADDKLLQLFLNVIDSTEQVK